MSRLIKPPRSCANCGRVEYVTLTAPLFPPVPFVRCAQCGFAYIADIQKDDAIIDNDSIAEHIEQRLLHSRNLNDWRILGDDRADAQAG